MLQTLYLAPGFFPPPPHKRIGRRQAVSLDGLLGDGTDRRDQSVAAAEPGAGFSSAALCASSSWGRFGQRWPGLGLSSPSLAWRCSTRGTEKLV